MNEMFVIDFDVWKGDEGSKGMKALDENEGGCGGRPG